MAATRRSARITAQSTPKLEPPTQAAPKTNGRKRKAPPAKTEPKRPRHHQGSARKATRQLRQQPCRL
ncbi:hypothetical protein CEP53_011829 [Fusarium sp. AF-6]|nr:hypothetical protein CEP53_011829 [Fusarium sp. AF-6]